MDYVYGIGPIFWLDPPRFGIFFQKLGPMYGLQIIYSSNGIRPEPTLSVRSLTLSRILQFHDKLQCIIKWKKLTNDYSSIIERNGLQLILDRYLVSLHVRVAETQVSVAQIYDISWSVDYNSVLQYYFL